MRGVGLAMFFIPLNGLLSVEKIQAVGYLGWLSYVDVEQA
jgi:hypothetical protein